MEATPVAHSIQKGDVYYWRGTRAVVTMLARDGSWAQLRFTPRDGSAPAWGRRHPLPLAAAFHPEADGLAPFPHLASVPLDWLEASAVYLAEGDGPLDPDALFAQRVDAIFRRREIERREGREKSGISVGPDDVFEELARRRMLIS